tara:strand:+ start:1056 stop:2198 length:1143 start_codon:yes stop_codon:yes gene_type:complete
MTPLKGLRILDFSTLLPGPFATMVLGDLGADIVRVEAPERPDLLREHNPSGHRTINRNKRSIIIDLKKGGAKDFVLDSLLPHFDILVEQFRPGVMKRLGLDYESLSKDFPKLIYCSISGYGQKGKYKSRAAHDLNLIARSGMASYGSQSDSSPEIPSNQWADLGGGSMYAMVAILSAVIERQSSGLGQHLDVSMLHGSLTNQAIYVSEILDSKATIKPRNQILNGGSFYGYYRCKDDRFLSIASLEPPFLKELSEILDLPELLSFRDIKHIRATLQLKISSENYDYWLAKFAHSNCCVEPVLELQEALDENRDKLIQMPQGTEQISHPVKFSRSEPEYKNCGSPAGQHTLEILKEFGISDQKISQLTEQGIVQQTTTSAD